MNNFCEICGADSERGLLLKESRAFVCRTCVLRTAQLVATHGVGGMDSVWSLDESTVIFPSREIQQRWLQLGGVYEWDRTKADWGLSALPPMDWPEHEHHLALAEMCAGIGHTQAAVWEAALALTLSPEDLTFDLAGAVLFSAKILRPRGLAELRRFLHGG
jgi:hypothetical protein